MEGNTVECRLNGIADAHGRDYAESLLDQRRLSRRKLVLPLHEDNRRAVDDGATLCERNKT